MTEEEILVRLKMDASQLDAETKKSLQSLAHFGQESHKHLLHGTSAARGFHRAMEKLTEAFPALGNVANIALSPIGGTFALIGTAIAFATKKVEEFNEKLAETAKTNAEAVTGRRVLTGKDTAFSGGLNTAEGLASFYEKRIAEMEGQRAKWQTEVVEGGESLPLDILEMGFPIGGPQIAKRLRGKSSSEASKNLAILDDYKRKLEALKQVKQDLTELDDEAGKSAEEFEKIAEKNAERRIDQLKKEAEEKKKQEEHDLEFARKQMDYNASFARLDRAGRQAATADYIPGLDELAKNNSPVGRIAQQVLLAQQWSKYSLGQGGWDKMGSAWGMAGDLGFDLRSAGNDPIARSHAYQRYGNRMQGLIADRGNMGDHLRIIAQEIVQLNGLALFQGLKVQGVD